MLESNISGFYKSPVTRFKVNIIKKFAHFNNCHCIIDIIYIYKKILNVKYRTMEATRIEIQGHQYLPLQLKVVITMKRNKKVPLW